MLKIITNSSYDISDMNQNLTDMVGSPPILNPKGPPQNQTLKNIFLRGHKGRRNMTTTTLLNIIKGPALCRWSAWGQGSRK